MDREISLFEGSTPEGRVTEHHQPCQGGLFSFQLLMIAPHLAGRVSDDAVLVLYR